MNLKGSSKAYLTKLSGISMKTAKNGKKMKNRIVGRLTVYADSYLCYNAV